jgi:hypothetical protein
MRPENVVAGRPLAVSSTSVAVHDEGRFPGSGSGPRRGVRQLLALSSWLIAFGPSYSRSGMLPRASRID